jgi:large subunit ribosomal protein L24
MTKITFKQGNKILTTRNKMKFRKGDQVLVISGKDKGKTGLILKVLPTTRQVIVEGINMQNKRLKPSQENPNPGLVSQPGPLHSSKISHLDPRTGLRTKIAYKLADSGEKIRISKKTGETI